MTESLMVSGIALICVIEQPLRTLTYNAGVGVSIEVQEVKSAKTRKVTTSPASNTKTS